LLLHLGIHLLALLHVGPHHALHGRPLEVQELGPQVLIDSGVFAIHRADLLLELALHVGEGLDVVLQILAHHALHGIAIEADHLGKKVAGEHGGATRLLFEDDLQQDVAGQVFAALGVNNLEDTVFKDEFLHVCERDVGAGLGVVKAAVRVLFYQANLIGHSCLLLGDEIRHCRLYCGAQKKTLPRCGFTVIGVAR